MQLSEQAKAALERCRVVQQQYKADFGPVITNNEVVLLVNEMLRLFPVKTLNGIVIRWDDPITPERLIASGFHYGDFCISHGGVEFYPIEGRWYCEGCLIPVPMCLSNMNEVWQLMAKCGCPVGGGE